MPSACTIAAACVVAVAAAVLAGCNLSVAEESRPTQAGVLPAPALEEERPPPTLPALVVSLDALEDALRTGEWSTAQARLGDVVRGWALVKPSVSRGGADGRAVQAAEVDLASLQVDLAMHEALGARAAALSFEGVSADIVGRYPSRVPPDVLRMDTAIRRVRLDVDAGDWAAAQRDVTAADAAWTRLEPAVGALARSAARADDASLARGDMSQAIDRVRAAISQGNAADVTLLTELALEEDYSVWRLWAEHGDVSP